MNPVHTGAGYCCGIPLHLWGEISLAAGIPKNDTLADSDSSGGCRAAAAAAEKGLSKKILCENILKLQINPK